MIIVHGTTHHSQRPKGSLKHQDIAPVVLDTLKSYKHDL